MGHRITGLIFAAAVGVSAFVSEAPGPRPLLVGLLRADCAALPFASYSAGQWERLPFFTPPASPDELEGPWYFTGLSGQRSILAAGEIVTFTGGDTFYEEWGVSTDHRPCQSGGDYPAERIGAVLTARIQVQPFELVGASHAPESISSTLRADFERLEQKALLDRRHGGDGSSIFGHPGDAGVRRQAALQVTELYTSSAGDTTFLYFVARREYRAAAAGAPFRPLSVLHGWGVRAGSETVISAAAVLLDNGSEMHVSTYRPYGTMIIDGVRHVIAERGGYESSSKEVLRWLPGGPAAVLPDF